MLEVPRLIIVISILVINITSIGLLAYITAARLKPSSRSEKAINARILGGKRTAITNYPFAVALCSFESVDLPQQILCGASIIGSYWTVTAGHCIDNFKSVGSDGFYFASGHDEWRRGTQHLIESYHRHEGYLDLENDIALIKVTSPFTGINKQIALASKNYIYKTNTTATVMGWGKLVDDDHASPSEIFYSVNVKLFDQGYCVQLYDDAKKKGLLGIEVSPNMFCAGDYHGGKDACQNDSGGPIVENGTLIGLVSWALQCGIAVQPGVYTRLGNYEDWIKSLETKLNVKIGVTFKP